jgi:hypothetical protein
MKRIIYFFAIFLLITSCSSIGIDKVNGNGDIQSETFEVSPFKDVSSSGDFQVTLIQDTLWKVDIEAESNLIALMEIETNGTKLKIGPKDGYSFRPNHPINIIIHHDGIQAYSHSGAGTIDVDQLQTTLLYIDFSGSGNILGSVEAEVVSFTISGSSSIDTKLNTNEIGIDISGSSNCKFTGESNSGSFTISGTSDIYAPELMLKNAEIRVSGSADMLLNVSEIINAKISGIGHIEYYGDAIPSIDISGSGYVKKKD